MMSIAPAEGRARAGAELRPYEVGRSSATIADIYERCNREMFSGYGARAGVSAAYPIAAYRQLIASLAGMKHVECVTLRELCRQASGGDRVRVAIRHDVDGDIVTAERGAEIEAEFGVRTSYYFQHTATYHGIFEEQRAVRHECVGHVYRRIQEIGHEVGLHSNGLEVYERLGMDGAEAVAAEIGWMRSIGLDVRGTVAHGSTAVFGAENFEIFKGRRKGRARDRSKLQEPKRIEHEGRGAWLHVLDEDELGLEYEGNDIFWQKAVRVEYGATRAVDGWRWNRRFDRDGVLPFCSQERVLADIEQLEPGCCVVLTVHPCYYGCRHRAEASPVLFLDRRETVVHRELGWRTWRPRSVVAVGEAHEDARLARQTMNVANELGMLDVSEALSKERMTAERRVLLLDGAALADAGVSSQSSAGRVVEAVLGGDARLGAGGHPNGERGRRVACMTLAHPGMGISRLWGWLRWGVAEFRPTDVVIGMGSLELGWSLPWMWSKREGLSWRHPAGECLVPGHGGEAEHRDRSAGWLVRQQKPRAVELWPGSDVRVERAMLEPKLARVEGVDARAFVGRCLERVAAACAGARLFVAMTDDGAALRDQELQRAYSDMVAGWASAVGAAVVDPFASYATLEAEGVSTLRACGGLSVDGHRALGEAIARAMQISGEA